MRWTRAVFVLVLGGVACERSEPVEEPTADPARTEAAPTSRLPDVGVVQQAAASSNPSNVLVVNGASSPVPTTLIGTASVSGSVTVVGTPTVSVANEITLAGTPTVAIAGTPTVAAAPKLTVAIVAPQVLTIPAGQEVALNLDVSEYEEVRILLRVPSLQNTMNLIVGSGPLNLDFVPLNGVENTTRTYRVPGTILQANLSNVSGSTAQNATIAVYGRP